MTNIDPARRKRRWRRRWLVLGSVAALIVAALTALPWALSTERAHGWLLSRADGVLAPAKLEVNSFRFSWFGPTRMTGFTIRDAQGEPALHAPVATWDRDLWHILTDRPRFGRLVLKDAALDVDRAEDGSVDLYEAIRPILGKNPRTALTVEVPSGTLRFRSPELAEPVAAERVVAELKIQPSPGPLTWQLDLAESPDANDAALQLSGRYNRWSPESDGSHDLRARIRGDGWPLVAESGGGRVRTRYDGAIDAHRHLGLWSLQGDTRLLDLDATAPPLAGDRVAFDRLSASWDVSQTTGGWDIARFDVDCPIATLSAQGTPGRSTTIQGNLDLPAIVAAFPHTIRLPEGLELRGGRTQVRVVAEPGSWDVRADLANLAAWMGEIGLSLDGASVVTAQIDEPAADTPWNLNLRADLPGLTWTEQGESLDVPATIDLKAGYRETDGRLNLASFRLEGPYGNIEASGTLDDLVGRRLADLRGTITPDWSRVGDVLTDLTEPEARLEADPIDFRLAGPLARNATDDDLWQGLDAEVRIPLTLLDVYGLRVGPTPLVARTAGGEITIEPIETTLNGGRLSVAPEIVPDADGRLMLRITPGSVIEGAEINDEVSRRVLAFVVPIMERATRAHGKVSVDVAHAEIPLDSQAERGAVVEGNVVFREVEFAPGPLADNLLTMIGRPDAPPVRLDEPVVLSVFDGKVHQNGLAIPIAGVTQFEMEGTVSFGGDLDLTASLPLTAEMFGQREVLGRIADGRGFMSRSPGPSRTRRSTARHSARPCGISAATCSADPPCAGRPSCFSGSPGRVLGRGRRIDSKSFSQSREGAKEERKEDGRDSCLPRRGFAGLA